MTMKAIDIGTIAMAVVLADEGSGRPSCSECMDGSVTVRPSGRPTSPEGKPATAVFKATRTGWHSVRTVRGETPGSTAIVILWLTDRLARPPERAAETVQWLEADKETEAACNTHAARELARYFLLERRGRLDTDIGRALNEMRHRDPYPELSQLGLDSEVLLGQLADEPEALTSDDWEDIREIGRQVRTLIGETPDGTAP